jgi:hypothetical protein
MATFLVTPIADFNRCILSDLDARELDVAAREREANQVLLGCEAERKKIKEERETIVAAMKVQNDYLVRQGMAPLPAPDSVSESSDSVTESSGDEQSEKRRRARIGPQRYQILKSLQIFGPISLAEIMVYTRLAEKRVKDQFRVDVPDIISETHTLPQPGVPSATKYDLTDDGLELLNRFEAYKKHRGESLPPLDEPQPDTDTDGSTEPQIEEVQ